MFSIIGIDCPYKPIPQVIQRNMYLFNDVETIIDIGAGRGRFVKWFLSNFPNIKEYVAIEPYPKFVEKLREIHDSRLTIIHDTWENVRDEFINRKFDVVILWDVMMFMDLRHVHQVNDPTKAVLLEIPYIVKMAKKYILFSLHPVKTGLISKDKFPLLFSKFEKYCRLLDKKYLNRIYVKI